MISLYQPLRYFLSVAINLKPKLRDIQFYNSRSLSLRPSISLFLYTVGENIIGAPKMRISFWYPIQMRKQYWTFLYCNQFSYRSYNFAIAKVTVLYLFALLFYLVFRLVHSFFSVLISVYSYCNIKARKSEEERQLKKGK